ncbi:MULTISPECIES: aspartate 4-decarboxylase [Clostridium]|jgi:aspartate 4-decarboxylase|uniref:aspartate 4-decarboxylase n=1 Tax=Clostridium TaxID=1485 RepID=UPI000C077D06|nr:MULTISPECIES: aspartate 4-decarboxylase [Clostridium]MDU2683478.1 aspartate 4-decarboxylase [Clostridium sp.]MDU8964288.1 aspartate 4-decarboxylase [Clostridium sp.]
MDKNLQREEIEKIYGKISPFEFKNRLIELAHGENEKTARILLDAGRGNPNWTASTPREAFFTFGLFAVDETKKDINNGDLAGMPKKNGIYNRFIEFIDKNNILPGTELLKKIIEYGINEKSFNADDYLYELTDAIIGDNYPVPDRMLYHIEEIVHDYLVQEMCYNKPPSGKFNIFAVEGATAAMCYIFDTLRSNMLLNPKDKIAIMVPIFTPYLEIPVLPRYDLEIVPIKATETTIDGTHTWQYPLYELEKLKDNSIKALFLVNPSNPPSVSLSTECRKNLVSIINEYNKDIMIISDDVYGTFVPEFRSLMADLPYNTIGVYSFSKYFGVTGWRLGTIAIHEKNIYDKLLKELSKDKKKILNRRYGDMKLNPETIPFIDRIVADSRQVALNHTAGLSTPQQVQMAFFCAFALLDDENIYKKQTIEICHRRQKLLFDSLGLSLRKDINDAAYYTEFDLLEWANYNYGSEFANYLESSYKPVEVLYRLAEESSIVLLSGSGFQGPEWSIRISLANLRDEDYTTIGKTLHGILDEFVIRWKESEK